MSVGEGSTQRPDFRSSCSFDSGSHKSYFSISQQHESLRRSETVTIFSQRRGQGGVKGAERIGQPAQIERGAQVEPRATAKNLGC